MVQNCIMFDQLIGKSGHDEMFSGVPSSLILFTIILILVCFFFFFFKSSDTVALEITQPEVEVNNLEKTNTILESSNKILRECNEKLMKLNEVHIVSLMKYQSKPLTITLEKFGILLNFMKMRIIFCNTPIQFSRYLYGMF